MRIFFTFFLFFELLFLSAPSFADSGHFNDKSSYSVCFPSEKSCINTSINIINNAKTSVLLQSSNSIQMPIAQALITAKQRGIDVVISLKNKPHLSKTILNLLYKNKIPIWLDNKPNSDNTPIIIVDNKVVVIGNLEQNKGNLLTIDDSGLASIYVKNWNKLLKLSFVTPMPTSTAADEASWLPTKDRTLNNLGDRDKGPKTPYD